jgi:hypothetical protein
VHTYIKGIAGKQPKTMLGKNYSSPGWFFVGKVGAGYIERVGSERQPTATTPNLEN